ncbi:BnaC08g12190D [Brassica napus]|uniref:BnaC08g12190D protein n=1 Tax=Brassica napus TaxID=3708 RepID=A0A078IJF4_BRANA|nr:BnaC08g12190D [Brassica napus]
MKFLLEWFTIGKHITSTMVFSRFYIEKERERY